MKKFGKIVALGFTLGFVFAYTIREILAEEV